MAEIEKIKAWTKLLTDEMLKSIFLKEKMCRLTYILMHIIPSFIETVLANINHIVNEWMPACLQYMNVH